MVFRFFVVEKTFFFHEIRSTSAQEIMDPGALCQILPDEVSAFAYYSNAVFLVVFWLSPSHLFRKSELKSHDRTISESEH